MGQSYKSWSKSDHLISTFLTKSNIASPIIHCFITKMRPTLKVSDLTRELVDWYHCCSKEGNHMKICARRFKYLEICVQFNHTIIQLKMHRRKIIFEILMLSVRVLPLFWRSLKNLQKLQQFGKLRRNAERVWLVTHFIKSLKCSACDFKFFKIQIDTKLLPKHCCFTFSGAIYTSGPWRILESRQKSFCKHFRPL